MARESFAEWMKFKAVETIEQWNYFDKQLLFIKEAYDLDSDPAVATANPPGTPPLVLEESSRATVSFHILYYKVRFPSNFIYCAHYILFFNLSGRCNSSHDGETRG